jgi:hypothetical protein
MRKVLLALFVAAHGFATEAIQETGKRQWELMPQLSVVSPSEFILTNSEYSIPYSTLLLGMPAVYMGIATPIKKEKGLQISLMGRIGYSYKSGDFILTSHSGEQKPSHLTLSWLPVSVGTIAEYSIPGVPFLKPMLTFGLGAEWLRQTGTLDGISTNFWLPYFYVSPAIGFFDTAMTSIDWFGGFTFGVTYQDSFGKKQKARAWSFDLSGKFVL